MRAGCLWSLGLLANGAGRPDYAFVNNATPEALEQVFRAIAHTVSRFRQTTEGRRGP